jgi:hypothetical protein
MRLILWIRMFVWRYKLKELAKDDPFIYDYEDE